MKKSNEDKQPHAAEAHQEIK